MADDPPENWWPLAILLGALAIFLFVVLNWVTPAKAETMHASPSGLAYCALYAREATRIDVMHTEPVKAYDRDYLEALSVVVFKQCVSILPTLLPLPDGHRNLDTWLDDMQAFMVANVGTEPAGEGDGGSEEWRQACRQEYVTWSEEDGTVVRRGSPERVRCPLVERDGAWVVP